jgi:hypothetical protein
VKLDRVWVRNIDAQELVDAYLVAAVFAVLSIRLYLFLSRYPQVGGGGLHVAHMLWGGLLMVVSQFLLLTLLARRARQICAVVGGLGFGLFIDELGKFITSDNNYFFKPAAGLIYLVFVLFFLGSRAFVHWRGFSGREYLVNAVELLKEAALRDMDDHERHRALAYLARAGAGEPLVAALSATIESVPPTPDARPSLLARFERRLRDRYEEIVLSNWFPTAVSGVFAALAAVALVEVVVVLLVVDDVLRGSANHLYMDGLRATVQGLSFVAWVELASALVAGTLVVAGFLVLRFRRLGAYRLFELSVFVTIFVTQPFTFYQAQFAAAAGLLVSLPLLSAVQFMIRREERRPAAVSARVLARQTTGP